MFVFLFVLNHIWNTINVSNVWGRKRPITKASFLIVLIQKLLLILIHIHLIRLFNSSKYVRCICLCNYILYYLLYFIYLNTYCKSSRGTALYLLQNAVKWSEVTYRHMATRGGLGGNTTSNAAGFHLYPNGSFTVLIVQSFAANNWTFEWV